ncbi:hypothetical protein EJ08DRAFT_240123 [Tothia fuscella]|uniref:Nudix hydrolase domain-containing protein n=1 Tax=Tothia fuscella TaxID=1048955 RepID=A0A9P4NRI3_9PEZI|nr:hypothetical protein EJ08DRAFT_240123 [Tothia fuscella]
MNTTKVHPPLKLIGTKKDDTNYTDRHAVQLVITNFKTQIAILHTKKDNYYKLPGGGIEPNESHLIAASREALEEFGGTVKINPACRAIAKNTVMTSIKFLIAMSLNW